MIINEKLQLEVESKVCLNSGSCYSVKTFIPWYITVTLIGSAFLIVKEIFYRR